MSDNSGKVPIGVSLGQAARRQAQNHIQLTGKALPASIVKMKGSIATVKFETGGVFTLPNVTVPMFMPEYTRHPMQPGDKGIVQAADVTIGNMSGLGPNAPASFTRPGNLSPLLFMPVGNANWTPVDPNKHVVYGPSGTQSRPTDSSSLIATDKTAGAAIATGAPAGVNPDNLDPTAYDHSVVTNGTNGVVATSKTKVDVNAPTHNINSAQTNANGNLAVSSLLTAAVAAFGSMTGTGGGEASIPPGIQLGGGAGLLTPALALAYQYFSPLTGTTLTLKLNSPVTLIDPAAAIAALTLTFPTGVDGAQIWLSFTQGVTTLTCSSATFAANAAITSVPSGGAQYRLFYAAGIINRWFRI